GDRGRGGRAGGRESADSGQRRRTAGRCRTPGGANRARPGQTDERASRGGAGPSEASARPARAGAAASSVRHREGPNRGHRQPQRPGGWAGDSGWPAAVRDHPARERVGDGEFQGDTAERHAAGTKGHSESGCVRRQGVHRQSGQHRGCDRGAIQPAAAGKRDREFRESRPARAGQDRPGRRTGSGPPPASGNVRGANGIYEIGNWTPMPPVNPWIIAISVMFATFMEVLDTTVVNVSLPHIAGNLSVTIDEATWVLTSYLVANAIILPMTGWLAATFGRKRLLM